MKAEPVQILKADELWQYITLADGTIIKHRTIILGVFRCLDENGNYAKNPDGSPMYGINKHEVNVIEKFEGKEIEPSNLKLLN